MYVDKLLVECPLSCVVSRGGGSGSRGDVAGAVMVGVGSGRVDSCVDDRFVEVREEMVFARQVLERAHGSEQPLVLGSRTLQQHGDVPTLQIGDDLGQRVGAGRVEHLQIGKSQDHDADVGDSGEVVEEPLRRSEEQRAVDAIGDDVFAEEFVLFVVVDLGVDRCLGE